MIRQQQPPELFLLQQLLRYILLLGNSQYFNSLGCLVIFGRKELSHHHRRLYLAGCSFRDEFIPQGVAMDVRLVSSKVAGAGRGGVSLGRGLSIVLVEPRSSNFDPQLGLVNHELIMLFNDLVP